MEAFLMVHLPRASIERLRRVGILLARPDPVSMETRASVRSKTSPLSHLLFLLLVFEIIAHSHYCLHAQMNSLVVVRQATLDIDEEIPRNLFIYVKM